MLLFLSCAVLLNGLEIAFNTGNGHRVGNMIADGEEVSRAVAPQFCAARHLCPDLAEGPKLKDPGVNVPNDNVRLPVSLNYVPQISEGLKDETIGSDVHQVVHELVEVPIRAEQDLDPCLSEWPPEPRETGKHEFPHPGRGEHRAAGPDDIIVAEEDRHFRLDVSLYHHHAHGPDYRESRARKRCPLPIS